ncbi:hypothetical protein [Actinoplanes sp. NPDC026623]|uniref:hypothetical protein n=1 Tax=Actinoplanes sp. NPDC026623 TaxID=3155610 RepID=UPI0033D9644A
MAPARSLHEIIAGLAGDAGTPGDLAAVLRAGGHPDLPEDLLAEAVVSFAGTAPAEVAEHLAPFVMAHGPIADDDTAAGEIGALPGLLATVPAAELDDDSAPAVPEIDSPFGAHDADAAQQPDVDDDDDVDDVPAESGWAPLDPAFGFGHDPTATPLDDDATDAFATEPDSEPAGYADPHDLPGHLDLPSPDADLWDTPALPGDSPEIDDIDDIDGD